MRKIPTIQSENRDVNQLQQFIQQGLTPLLMNPYLNGRLIEKVNLVSGSNSVNHGLGRKLQGWVIVRKRSDAAIFDTQDVNPIPDKTLDLQSDVDVSINLYVF